MKTLPDTHVREASRCLSPVEIWQTLLTRLLDQHYGLTLNDTPFADERVIEQHIEAGISLCDAVNFLVENTPGAYRPAGIQRLYPLSVNKQYRYPPGTRATGLMTRDNYRTVNNITR